MPTWNIKTTGVIFIATLLVAGAVLITVSLIIKRDISLFNTVWNEFEESRSVKTRIVTAFRGDVGYGGMIHHFKNYVLRHETWRADIVERKLDAASSVLARYLDLPTGDSEHRAVEDIYKVLAAYSDALRTARESVASCRTANLQQYRPEQSCPENRFLGISMTTAHSCRVINSA
jgi:hypothetical protein